MYKYYSNLLKCGDTKTFISTVFLFYPKRVKPIETIILNLEFFFSSTGVPSSHRPTHFTYFEVNIDPHIVYFNCYAVSYK